MLLSKFFEILVNLSTLLNNFIVNKLNKTSPKTLRNGHFWKQFLLGFNHYMFYCFAKYAMLPMRRPWIESIFETNHRGFHNFVITQQCLPLMWP